MPKGLSPQGRGDRVLLPVALQPQAGFKQGPRNLGGGVPNSDLHWARRQHAQRSRLDWKRGCGGVTAMAAGTWALSFFSL